MSWFKKEKTPLAPADKKSRMPEGLWSKCKGCSEILYKKEIVRNSNVCPRCNYHFGLSATERLAMLLDGGSYEEFDSGIRSTNPLRFKDTKRYQDRLKTGREQTGLDDAIMTVKGTINGIPVIVAAMEYGFIGGSMGVVVGEKITRAVERALEERTALSSFLAQEERGCRKALFR